MTNVQIQRRMQDILRSYNSRLSVIATDIPAGEPARRDSFEAGAGRSMAVEVGKLIEEIDAATDKAAADARERDDFPGRYDPPADEIPQGHPEDDQDHADNVGYW